MSFPLKIGKNLILLFVCGFWIGIFLEIVIIEKGKFKPASKPEALSEGISITCLILLKHKHTRYVDTSKKTWLKHCHNYHVVRVERHPKHGRSSFESNVTTVPMGTCERGDAVEVVARSGWSGLCKALRLTRGMQSQWLVVVPDSVVVLVENLKHFVRHLDGDGCHYYGYALSNYEADYNVLSAGIVLSRGTLNKLLEKFKSEEECDVTGKYWKNEDLYLGKYLKELNILPKDSRDEDGRGRFHGYNLNNLLWPGKLFTQSDYSRKALHPVSKGFNCCSPHLITMEVSNPDAMYNLYFFLYKLTTVHKKIPAREPEPDKTGSFSWKDFLREEGFDEGSIDNMTSEEYYQIWEKKLPPDVMYQKMRDFVKDHKEEEA